MLATDGGELLCLDGDGKLVWEASLPYGPLAGAPLETDDNWSMLSDAALTFFTAGAPVNLKMMS